MPGKTIITCLSLIAVDGDMAKCDGVLLRPMGDGAPHVSGFDAPEKGGRAKCAHERQLAEQATQRFAELIATPGMAIESSGVSDRYDRPLVAMRLPDGSTVGRHMIAEGLAEVRKPGRRIDWCQ